MLRLLNLWLIFAVFLFSCKSEKEKVRDMLMQGETLAGAGNNTAAILLYDKAVSRDPWLKKGFYLRGVAKLQSGNYRQALQDFERTEAIISNGSGIFLQKNNILNPEENYWEVNYQDVLFHKAAAYLNLDSLKEAWGYLDYLIRNQYRETSLCFLWRGEMMLNAGEKEKACTEFMKAKLSAIEMADRDRAAAYLTNNCKGKMNPDTLRFYQVQ